MNFAVSVEKYETEIPYIAISHIWADRLAHFRSNEMPICQLERIYRYVRRLTGPSFWATWVGQLIYLEQMGILGGNGFDAKLVSKRFEGKWPLMDFVFTVTDRLGRP